MRGWFRKRGADNARVRGDALRDMRAWAQAADEYRRWLLERPDDAAIWIQLGHMLGQADDPAGADAAYRRAAALTPDDADLALCRGHLAMRMGDVATARAFYAESHRLDGNPHAAKALADTAEPGAAPAAPPEAAPGAPYAGRLDGWLHYYVSGIVYPGEAADAYVELRCDGAVVGRAALQPPDADGGRRFETMADYPGDAAHVTARLMPAGLELENSPVLLVAPPRPGPDSPPAWAADILTVKPLDAAARAGEVALFVTHSPAGAIKPHVLPYMAALSAAGVAVLLIVVADRPVELSEPLVAQAAGVIVRANAGWDFAAWAHVLHLQPELYGARRLYLVNDSLFGPSSPDKLAAIVEQVRAHPADLVGLTASHEWHWHVQSYFLALGPRLLSSYALHDFMHDVRILDDKDAVIHAYEARLTRHLEAADHPVAALFESSAAINPTLFDWRGLVERGFPFVKVLLMRGAFPEADITGWRETLAAAGFDMAALEAVLLPTPSGIPDSGDRRLLARVAPLPPLPDRPMRIAFYGPWNHDNGLGAASRNLIAALRRTGARINLSPVRKPFHVHRPIGPAADIREFEGDADIALVHLNPDSWHLLDDAQRAAILRAPRRIGYWVWEMETLPPAWNAEIWAVDRIWAPSSWCAEVFARDTNAPVDVIPHPLPAPKGEGAGRAALAALGVPAEARTILYVFDGSSYLVRKNPAALVRAFAASGLEARGWRLILKTKHLMDRPEEGEAFRALADGTAGVMLVDRAMAEDDLADLMAACDIYASPHCAEGFGLTVAEAMAHSRAVVATDYSGTRDMLDATTGWPVRAHDWELAEDHGHYLAGYRWARVDEPALAHALTEAAAAVEAGDTGRQQAAAARIAARLSPDAVAAQMADSFRATMAGPPRHFPAPRWGGEILRGLPVEEALFGPLVAAAVFPGPVPEGETPWVALLPAGTLAMPMLESVIARWTAARPDADIFLGDDFARDDPWQLRLFPEFDPVLLASRGYHEAPLVVRRAALAQLGEAESVDALLLRAAAAGLSIVRLAQVLSARREARPEPDMDARRALLARHLPDHDIVPGAAPGLLAVARRFTSATAPVVTLIIPTRRSLVPGTDQPYVARLLDALETTDWPMDRLRVIVGDDVTGTPDWESPRPYALHRIETPREKGALFNYAAKMNRLWRAAETEQLVFLNDDLMPEDDGWLKALMTFAVERDVGGVGARLSYEDGRLQHAGIMPFGGRVAHAWAGRAEAAGTYQEWALAQRQWSMVTGAVFATRASAMAAVNGFDEAFTLEYNDIDLCLRLRAAGWRIVYTPAARLIHAEKASRGAALPRGDEIAAFLTRWRAWLADDPAWHPMLGASWLEVAPRSDGAPWYG